MFFGFKWFGVMLVTAIPFGIYDLVEAMDDGLECDGRPLGAVHPRT